MRDVYDMDGRWLGRFNNKRVQRYVGRVLSSEGRVLSNAREQETYIDCRPAGNSHWLDEQKIRRESDIWLYLLAMNNLCTGNYRGEMPSLSKYWDDVKNDNGIGFNKYPGMK